MRDLVARTTLYDLVWSVPMSKLAKQLQLSDRGLAKICARENIPVPPRGYWAKLQYGKPVGRPPLDPTPEGHRDWIPVAPRGSALGAEGREWIRSDRERLGWHEPTARTPELEEPAHERDLHVLAWRTRRQLARARVRSNELASGNRHPEVQRMMQPDDRHAFMRPHPSERFRGPGPRRRLAFFNALFLALESVGCRATLTDLRAEQLEVSSGNLRLACRLKSTFIKDHAGVRTERLDFFVYQSLPWQRERFAWKERRGVVLGDRLVDVVVGIVVAAELERRDLDWREYERALQRREELRREQERRRTEVRLTARKELIAQAEAMRQASAVRELIAAVRRRAPCDDPKVARWQAWALQQAEALDPVCGGSLSFEVPN